jgi:hypothetical protein
MDRSEKDEVVDGGEEGAGSREDMWEMKWEETVGKRKTTGR